jgi:hypothetical protein
MNSETEIFTLNEAEQAYEAWSDGVAAKLAEAVEALEAIKEFADQGETHLIWETADAALIKLNPEKQS